MLFIKRTLRTLYAPARWLYPPLWAQHAPVVTPLDVRLKGLDEAFDGYRIAHITDLHLGTGQDQASWQNIVHQINALKPDLVVMTGDYITNGDVHQHLDALRVPLEALRARDGVVAVLGNHDYYSPQNTDDSLTNTDGDTATRLTRLLERLGVRVLRNEVLTLRRGAARLHVAGLDDVIWGRHDLPSLLGRLLVDDAPALLLVHEPDFADFAAKTRRFDLQLSGHSHGGQIARPNGRPWLVPRYATRYPSGRYQVGAMTLYTNRGLGTLNPPIRLHCPAEIALITLHRT